MRGGLEIAIGNGVIEFWGALERVASHQTRKVLGATANILDKIPKSVQPSAKNLIREMYLAPIKKDVLRAFDVFLDMVSNTLRPENVSLTIRIVYLPFMIFQRCTGEQLIRSNQRLQRLDIEHNQERSFSKSRPQHGFQR